MGIGKIERFFSLVYPLLDCELVLVDVLEPSEVLEKLPDLKSPLELLLELELLLVLELLLDLGEEKLPDLKSPLELFLELELVVLLELLLLLDLGEEKLPDLKLFPEGFEVLLDFEPPDFELLACTVMESVVVFKVINCGVIACTHKNKKVSNRDMIKYFLFNLILHTSLFRYP